MPKLVTLPDVLREVYVWNGLEECKDLERPMSFKTFKRIMLGSELIVTEKTIRQKYEQIVCAGFAKESSNPNIIVLDVPGIRRTLICEHKIFESLSDPKPVKLESNGSHTQTHTNTEVGA